MSWSAPQYQPPTSIRDSAPLEHWLLAARLTAARHNIQDKTIAMARSGSDVVIECERHFFKMAPPRFQSEQLNEREMLRFVSNRLVVKTPEVVAYGELDGWPYFWMTRVEGVSLASVYPTMSHDERLSMASMLGELVASLHALTPPDGDSGWDAFFTTCRESASRRHTKTHLASSVESFMQRNERPGTGPSLLHTEVLDEHVLVVSDGSRWRVSSLIDFADSRVGMREYELPALVEFIFRAEDGLFSAFMKAYGSSALIQPERLLYWNLLHQFGSLPRMLQAAGEPTANSLEALAARLYQ